MIGSVSGDLLGFSSKTIDDLGANINDGVFGKSYVDHYLGMNHLYMNKVKAGSSANSARAKSKSRDRSSFYDI